MVFEYAHVEDASRRAWAVWSPTASEREVEVVLEGLPGPVVKAERMALADGAPEAVEVKVGADGKATPGVTGK
jgi:hypothetical protein